MKMQKNAIIIIIGLIVLGVVIYFILGKVQNMAVMKAKGDAMREIGTQATGILGQFIPRQ